MGAHGDRVRRRFGAELDSLADFVNFGCAPGMIVYLWGLHDFGNVGWIAAMVFAICGALRLARFNVMIDDPNRPLWSGNFFTGVPAPAGALVVMLPIYVNLLGGPKQPRLVDKDRSALFQFVPDDECGLRVECIQREQCVRPASGQFRRPLPRRRRTEKRLFDDAHG